jgi:transcriptional regulator with XRE-family HTH domain
MTASAAAAADPNRLNLLTGLEGLRSGGRKTMAQIAQDTGVDVSTVRQILNMTSRGPRDTTGEMAAFKKIVGKYGLAHNPELNSEYTANYWLNQKRAAAAKIEDEVQREKALARWNNYQVTFEKIMTIKRRKIYLS